jgi:hypothetical protein
LDPITLRAHDEKSPRRKSKVLKGLSVMPARGSHDPKMVLLTKAKRVICVRDLDERYQLCCTYPRFCDNGGYRASPVAIENDTISTEALSGAKNRPKILGIVYRIGQDKKSGGIRRNGRENLGEAKEGSGCCTNHDALMTIGVYECGKSTALGVSMDGYLTRKAGEKRGTFRGTPHLEHPFRGDANQFSHRIATHDPISNGATTCAACPLYRGMRASVLTVKRRLGPERRWAPVWSSMIAPRTTIFR